MKEHSWYLLLNRTLGKLEGFSSSFKAENKNCVRFIDTKASWNNDCLKTYFFNFECQHSAKAEEG